MCRLRSQLDHGGAAWLPIWLAAFGLVALAAPPARAQLPQARLLAVHPTGARQGTTVELTLAAGADLDECDQLYFSHPGITAVPKTQTVEGKVLPIANQFVVTVAADVPVGVYDLRAKGLFGLSNPRSFTVGDRPEVLETEPNNQADKAMPLELDTVVNGRSDGGADVDWFKFKGTAGQRVIAAVESSRIDSRMEAVIELYSGGRRVLRRAAANREAALVDFTVPADGEYFLKVHDLVFNGSAEYFYRLSLHTGPYIDFVVPASGLPGTTSEFTLYGRNLPGGQPSGVKARDGRVLDSLKVATPLPGDPTLLQSAEPRASDEAAVDGTSFVLPSAMGSSNPVTIYLATAPTAVEAEPNDAAANAQRVAPPVELTGQFQIRGDTDVFAFDAKSGEVFWIELFGQRDGRAADPVLVIDQVRKNEKGEDVVTRITAVDDNPLNVGGAVFSTISDDPVFRFAAPNDATFRVTVRDRAFENRGDPAMVYRLSIRKETPDFRLVVAPVFPTADPNQQASTWDLGIRKGDQVQLLVMALRRDGFNGDILISAEGLPEGVSSPGASIGPNQNSATLLLSSTEQAPNWFGAIRILGKARVDDPAASAAVAAAEAARTAAAGALPALNKAHSDAENAVKSATEAAAKAKQALDNDQNNEALKKASADADAALVKASEALKSAAEAKAAGEKKLADANAALAAARQNRDAAARELVREARGGTIVWSGNPGAQVAAVSRVARTLTLAVLGEVAPFQVTTDNQRFTVNQGSQILLPLKLVRRGGFDNNVALNFVAPAANAQVENKPINKGASEGLYRLFVPNNAPPGTYTYFIQGQAQVAYSRNPNAAARAAQEKEAADKLAAETAEAAKKAADAKAAADKLAADTANAAKKSAEAKAAADKMATDAANAAKLAADEKAKADKAVADAEAVMKSADEAALKAKQALDNDANNETLKKAKADADAAAAKAAEVLKAAREAKAVADKKSTDAAEAAKKAADAKSVADKDAADAEAAAKKAAEDKAAADKLAAETDQKSKAAQAAKAAADKKATDAANAAKPQNVNVFVPAAAVTVTIKQAPGTLAVNVPGGGALKRGEKLEVKVTVNRANGFAGPVTLSLPVPPGVAGIAAEPVTIPADKNEGVLVITAAGDATMGQLANMVVRASMEFNGPASIDQAIPVNVQ